MNCRNPTIAFIFLLAAAFPADANEVTIQGRAVIEGGAPAIGAEVIVKDSWAGFFVMRERVLFRTTTNENGEFSTPKLKYRHTIDILVMEKPCGWLATNWTLKATDQVAPGGYDVTIKLPDTKMCSTGQQPNNSFKPSPLRGLGRAS